MKLGLHIPTTGWQGDPARLGPTLGEVVEAAEAAGFDAIGVLSGRRAMLGIGVGDYPDFGETDLSLSLLADDRFHGTWRTADSSRVCGRYTP